MSTLPVHVRAARPEDAPRLADLAARTFRDAFGPENKPADLALHLATHYTADRMEAEIRDPGCTTLLAEVDGTLVGYAQLFDKASPVPGASRNGPGRMLHRFYLEQAWIGRGIAQQLMAAVKEDGMRRGAGFLWLTVWQRNPRAVAFYRKCGFTVAGDTTFMVGTDAQRDWVMSCPL